MTLDDKYQLEKEREAPGVSDEFIRELRSFLDLEVELEISHEEMVGLLNRLERAEHARDMWRTAFHSIKQE